MWATDGCKKQGKKSSTTLPLDKYVANQRGELKRQYDEVPELQKHLEALTQRAGSMLARHELRQRKDIEREMEVTRKEIEVRLSRVREEDYERCVAPYMQAYMERVEFQEATADSSRNISCPGSSRRKETIDSYVIESDATAKRQTAIVNEYLSEMNMQAPKIAVHTRDSCPICSEKLLLVAARAIMVCGECGYSVTYLDSTMSSMSYNDEVEFSSFSYKRINHFNEWLQQVQAKESYEVPAETIELVMQELYRQRVTKLDDITPRRVRDTLKTLKLRKSYEHVAQITSRLTGRRAPRMSPETEDTCRLMFIAVQPVFEKHCPKDRKNFLSYSYCLYKFFQILGCDEFLDSFSLLKGRDKLFRQDEIFKKICVDLDWVFYPSL